MYFNKLLCVLSIATLMALSCSSPDKSSDPTSPEGELISELQLNQAVDEANTESLDEQGVANESSDIAEMPAGDTSVDDKPEDVEEIAFDSVEPEVDTLGKETEDPEVTTVDSMAGLHDNDPEVTDRLESPSEETPALVGDELASEGSPLITEEDGTQQMEEIVTDVEEPIDETATLGINPQDHVPARDQGKQDAEPVDSLAEDTMVNRQEPAKSSTDAEWGTYVIEPRETLSLIAKKLYGNMKEWREIAQINNISNPNRIYAGHKIKINLTKLRAYHRQVRHQDMQMVTVKPGDSLSRISKQLWGQSWYWRYLWVLNKDKIPNPNVLYVGQKLYYKAKPIRLSGIYR